MFAVLLSAAIGATIGVIYVYNIAKSNGALVVGVRALVTKATGSGYYLVFDETYDKML